MHKNTRGPYLGKDGRRRMWVTYQDNSKKIITYARFLMEEKIGRILLPEETVDHIDRNKLNDTIGNLRIVDRIQHVIDDSKRVRLVSIACVRCGKMAKKRGRDLQHNAKLKKAGPFCGRSCAGKYGQEVQVGGKKLPAQKGIPIENREYFLKDKNAPMLESADKLHLK